jgi:hypothetical protein
VQRHHLREDLGDQERHRRGRQAVRRRAG